MKVLMKITVVLAVLVCSAAVFGAELHVPSQYPTIQAAISSAKEYDTVIVAPGTYNEDVDFHGKNIVLTSENPNDSLVVSNTIISSSGDAVKASNGSLLGFTIRTRSNGVICGKFSPRIIHCYIIVLNGYGYAINLSPATSSRAIIENNIIISDYIGIYLDGWPAATIIRNNVIIGRGQDSRIGIQYRSGDLAIVSGNIITNWETGIDFTYATLVEERKRLITYNNIWANQTNYQSQGITFDLTGLQGNISKDPLFFNDVDGDFHLLIDSPCRNAGDPNFSPTADATDIDGDPRILEGRVDIGADEFNPNLGPPLSLMITGPAMVIENSPSKYTATAFYGNGSTRNVSELANWWVEPNMYANIEDNGVLHTSDIETPQNITISAGYIDGSASVTAEIDVQIYLSKTIYVPADYANIQAAIDAADYSDTIVVFDGIYTGAGNRDIRFRGKGITVRSENGPKNCVVDCERYEEGFIFDSGEGRNSVLDGFRIVNADWSGIECYDSSPTIRNCILTGNRVYGIECVGGSPDVRNCILNNNRAFGIECWGGGNPIIINCMILENGIGMNFYDGTIVTVRRCTIAGNVSGGIRCHENGLEARNCIVWGNGEEQIQIYETNEVGVYYSNIEDGWAGEGNIEVEPLLTRDGHLGAGSPCINTGDPGFTITSSEDTDIDGEPRIMGGQIDMGADEFLDTDGDGLPDFWESKYFGTVTAAEPQTDPDGDGLTNIVEYEVFSSVPTIGAITYYVDVNDGSDAYDGRAPDWDGEHGPKLTIQAAINTGNDTDTIIVMPGLYVENINFLGKALTVRSSDPGNWDVVKSTIIKATSSVGRYYSCVSFRRGEDRYSILDGFTITGGIGTSSSYTYSGEQRIRGNIGGGIYCYNSSPTIRRCNISGNGRVDYYTTVFFGGGIALLGNCQAVVSDCIIANNEAQEGGAGIIIRARAPEKARSKIINCTIANNNITEPYWSEERYEVDCGDTHPQISNTIIWRTEECTYYYYDDPICTHSLIISDPCLVSFSCVQSAYVFNGWENPAVGPYDLTVVGGNINESPRFVRLFKLLEDEPDYHLLAGSPCIDAGNSNYAGENGGKDIDGQPRMMGGRIDIGADEAVPQITVTKPQEEDIWTGRSVHEIEWASYPGSKAVDILFSEDGGESWRIIANDVNDTGIYVWQLARADSDQCMVKVVPGVEDSNVICTASGAFSIWPYEGPRGAPRGHKKPAAKYGPEYGCVKWNFETQGPVSAAVTLGEQKGKHLNVYIASEDGKVYAVDFDTGQLIWSYDVNSPIAASAAVDHFGTVYVGAEDGKLYAIDKNGQLLWTHQTGGPIYSSPVASREGVYVCSLDGAMYALGRDGSEMWCFETDGFGQLGGSIFATPIVGYDGTVYVAGLYDPNLYALDAENGSIKWKVNFSYPVDPCDPNGAKKAGWPFAAPAVGNDGTIYLSLLYNSEPVRISEGHWSLLYPSNLYAIEPEMGSVIWASDMTDPCSGLYEPNVVSDSAWSSPAVGPDGTIYVSLDDPYLRAVEPNGAIKWVTELGTVGAFTLSVGDDGLIYAAGDDKKLYVVNADGELIAEFEGDGWLSFPVLAPEHTIIVSDANNTVWAITQENCRDGDIVLGTGNESEDSGSPSNSKKNGKPKIKENRNVGKKGN